MIPSSRCSLLTQVGGVFQMCFPVPRLGWGPGRRGRGKSLSSLDESESPHQTSTKSSSETTHGRASAKIWPTATAPDVPPRVFAVDTHQDSLLPRTLNLIRPVRRLSFPKLRRISGPIKAPLGISATSFTKPPAIPVVLSAYAGLDEFGCLSRAK